MVEILESLFENLGYEVFGGIIVAALIFFVFKPAYKKYKEKVHNREFDDSEEGFNKIAEELQKHCQKYNARTIILRKLPFEFTRKYFDLLELDNFDNKNYTDSIERVIRNGDFNGKGWWCWSIIGKTQLEQLDKSTCDALKYVYFPKELDPLTATEDSNPTDTCELVVREKPINRAFILLGEIQTDTLVADSKSVLESGCKWNVLIRFDFSRVSPGYDIRKWNPSSIKVTTNNEEIEEHLSVFIDSWDDEIPTHRNPPDEVDTLEEEFAIDVSNINLSDGQKWRGVLDKWYSKKVKN